MTKKDNVLQHLQTEKSITSLEAIYKYHATRLADIFYKLKKEGHIITTETIQAKDKKTHYAKYIYNGKSTTEHKKHNCAIGG